MTRYIIIAALSSVAKKAATEDAVKTWVLEAVVDQLKLSLKYAKDPVREEVAAPIDILRGTQIGDADDVACALLAALVAAGFECRLVLRGYDGKPYCNALVQVKLPSGWIYVDILDHEPLKEHSSEALGPVLEGAGRPADCDEPQAGGFGMSLEEMTERYNQPCRKCRTCKGTFKERGFNRCNACGYPGQ